MALSVEVNVQFEVRTRAARLWLQLVAFPVGLLFGARIGVRVGIWGAWRLARWRTTGKGTGRIIIGKGKWQRFDRELHVATARDAEHRR